MSLPTHTRTHWLGVATASLAVLAGAHGTATPANAQSAFTVDDVFNVASVNVLDFSHDGRWVVASTLDLRGRLGTVAARTGDPTYVSPALVSLYVVDTRTGDRKAILPAPATVADASFSPDGGQVALLVHVKDEFRLALYDVATGRLEWPDLPSDVRLAGEQGQSVAWTERGSDLILPVRAPGWVAGAQAEFSRLTDGPITEYKGDAPFLAWEALRRRGAEVGFARFHIDSQSVEHLADAIMMGRGGFAVAGDRLVFEADITQKTSYEVIFGTHSELRTRGLDEDESKTLVDVPETRRLLWSDDHEAYAYAEKGHVYLGTLDAGEPRNVTGTDDDSATAEAPDDEDDKERFSAMAVGPAGRRVAVTSKDGIWIVDARTRERLRLVDRSEDDVHPDRFDFVSWSPSGEAIYFSYGAGTQWQRGLVRFDTRSGERRDLVLDDRLYTGFRLSENGETFVFSAAQGNRPYDLYTADADLRSERRVLESNPTLANKQLGATELIEYLDVDGDALHGVLYYPVDYVEGTAVPTIFLVYEQFFDDRFNATIAVLNNAGYAVMQPSVDLEIGFPGEAWMKGVTAAANELVRRGIADPKKLGVHGTSYGGYATNLLITQTDRFAAAINISGKVDMVSFYFDSPRLGVRNIHAPENSQDRLGATLWEQPQKYIAHSAVMFADRIETPLLLMTGEEDHNVPARTTLEMYYALRRLGKTVEWVNYTNGGHGMPRTTEAEVRDYHERILTWYDRFLKNDGNRAATEQGSGHQ